MSRDDRRRDDRRRDGSPAAAPVAAPISVPPPLPPLTAPLSSPAAAAAAPLDSSSQAWLVALQARQLDVAAQIAAAAASLRSLPERTVVASAGAAREHRGPAPLAPSRWSVLGSDGASSSRQARGGPYGGAARASLPVGWPGHPLLPVDASASTPGMRDPSSSSSSHGLAWDGDARCYYVAT